MIFANGHYLLACSYCVWIFWVYRMTFSSYLIYIITFFGFAFLQTFGISSISFGLTTWTTVYSATSSEWLISAFIIFKWPVFFVLSRYTSFQLCWALKFQHAESWLHIDGWFDTWAREHPSRTAWMRSLEEMDCNKAKRTILQHFRKSAYYDISASILLKHGIQRWFSLIEFRHK